MGPRCFQAKAFYRVFCEAVCATRARGRGSLPTWWRQYQ